MRLFSFIHAGQFAHNPLLQERKPRQRGRQRDKSETKGGMGLAGEGLQEAGRRIGRNYRIIKKLGHGGDGTIYLAQHCPTEQFRAAKLLKADAPGRRRHELDMMKRLKHPALPQIYDVLEEQGELWLIMEFIRGKTLSELCAEGKLGPDRFFAVARQLADVLVYLHTRKPPILHLDIKPSNIMIRDDGTVTLIDFGAAVRADAGNREGCFGTPGFAAPEQWDPSAKPDARTDFYGFGAVLYYCLYGSVPAVQKGPDGKRHKRSRSAKIGGAENIRGARWRREATALIRRCMQEDREQRFPDTRSLYRSVERAEKRYLFRKKACRSSAAVLFLFAASIFAAANLGQSEQGEAKAAQAQRSYDMLLEQAEGLGFAQAVSCYEQAAGLCPEDGAWCEGFLARLEADYTFSLEEETALKKLMFSVPPGNAGTEEEVLEKCAPEYGSLAYRIGILYWYFYEGSGGKSAAAKWFDRAIDWQERQETSTENGSASWLESARIHAKIGGYYEILGKQGPDGSERADVGTYWEDLTRLWGLDSLKRDSVRVQCEVAQELLSVLIMQSSELKKEGADAEQLGETLRSIESFLSEHPEAEQIAEESEERCRAAGEALERTFDGE